MALQTKSLTTSFDIIRFFLQKWTKISENALLVVKYGIGLLRLCGIKNIMSALRQFAADSHLTLRLLGI